MFDKFLQRLLISLLLMMTGCKAEYTNYTQLGLESLKKQDIYEAFTYFEKAINQNPSDVSNYLIVGQCYFQLKFYQRSVYAFAAATRVDPSNGDAYFFLSRSYMYIGDIENAVKSAKKSITIYYRQNNIEGLKQSVMLLKSLELKNH